MARRRRRRNPTVALGTMKEWTQGIDLMDAAAAGAGLMATSMIPSAIIPTADTTMRKVMKLGLAALTSVAAGAVGRSFISPSAGKAAIIGGLAGTVVAALGIAGVSVGKPSLIRRLPVGNIPRRIGMPEMVSPAPSRESETVSIITP